MVNKLVIGFELVILAFAVVGVILGGGLSHELIHKYDLKDLAYDDEVCILDLRDFTAHYDFKTDYPDEAREILIRSEVKGYGVSILFIVLFTVAVLVVGWRNE